MTTIGVSLFTIALGAILKFAVTAHTAGIDLATVGVILKVVGGVGLCVGLWLYLADREYRESADRVWRRRVRQ
ncbi:MAG: hypothetical protein JO243_23310 [Solirubrobacterales bacterium]|nr:hypothetical protein [Solirubrobacterales bacterium]